MALACLLFRAFLGASPCVVVFMALTHALLTAHSVAMACGLRMAVFQALPIHNPPTVVFAGLVLVVLLIVPPSFRALVHYYLRWIGVRLGILWCRRYRNCQSVLTRVTLRPQFQSWASAY